MSPSRSLDRQRIAWAISLELTTPEGHTWRVVGDEREVVVELRGPLRLRWFTPAWHLLRSVSSTGVEGSRTRFLLRSAVPSSVIVAVESYPCLQWNSRLPWWRSLRGNPWRLLERLRW